MRSGFCAAALATAALGTAVVAAAQAANASDRQDVQLKPTEHPRLPADSSKLWMVPQKSNAARPPGLSEFAAGVKLEIASDFARALPIFSSPAVQQGQLGPYAEYYKGLAELRLGRVEQARSTFRALTSREPVGYLVEAGALRE